jgi:hypothetical protein
VADDTLPSTFDALIYDAVCAVVINAEELTHDALFAVNGTKLMEDAVSALVATDALSDEDAHEALNAYAALSDEDAHDALICSTCGYKLGA